MNDPTNPVQPAPNEQPEMDETLAHIEHLLSTSDLSERSRIRQSLWAKLTQQTTQPTHERGFFTMSKPTLKGALALMLIIAFIAITGPALTTYAQNLLAQVGLFAISPQQEVFETGPSIDQQAGPTPTPIPAEGNSQPQTELISNADGAMATLISAEAAAEIAGFDVVREPTTTIADYAFAGRLVLGDGNITVTSYWNSTSQPTDSYWLTQTTGEQPTDLAVGPLAQVSAVTVGSHAATLVMDSDLSSSDGRLFTLLLWEDGPYTYLMGSPSLSAEQLLALANSLYP